jgi:predicted RNase H-related nuclease YkuK (DUF458 family)
MSNTFTSYSTSIGSDSEVVVSRTKITTALDQVVIRITQMREGRFLDISIPDADVLRALRDGMNSEEVDAFIEGKKAAVPA